MGQGNHLAGVIRDHAGVMIEPPHHSEGDKADIRRPADDAEFAASKARIARSVLEAAVEYRKPPFQDDSVVEYEGFSSYPSFCQIAHRKHQGRVQLALIHMPNGSTSPTNMIESLATHFRQQFYPKVDPGLIDWFDVVPPDTYSSGPPFDKLSIDPVKRPLHADSREPVDSAWLLRITFVTSTFAWEDQPQDRYSRSPPG